MCNVGQSLSQGLRGKPVVTKEKSGPEGPLSHSN
jgi:hypothetical protein